MSTLTIGPLLACTRAFCASAPFDDAFLRMLAGESAVTIDGNTLTLAPIVASSAFDAERRGCGAEATGTAEGLDINSDQSYIMAMKQIAAAKFKEQCLSLLDRVDPDGIVITKHGKPVAKLVPFAADSAGLIGSLRGKVHIKGDTFSTGLHWDAKP